MKRARNASFVSGYLRKSDLVAGSGRRVIEVNAVGESRIPFSAVCTPTRLRVDK